MGIWEEYELWAEQAYKESRMRSLPYGEEVECLMFNSDEFNN